jgi:hypothetical protein
MAIDVTTHYSCAYCANAFNRVTELPIKVGLLKTMPTLDATLNFAVMYYAKEIAPGDNGERPRYLAYFPGYSEQSVSWIPQPDYVSLSYPGDWRGKHTNNITFECTGDIDGIYVADVVGWFLYESGENTLLWVEAFENAHTLTGNGDKIEMVVEGLIKCSTDIGE